MRRKDCRPTRAFTNMRGLWCGHPHIHRQTVFGLHSGGIMGGLEARRARPGSITHTSVPYCRLGWCKASLIDGWHGKWNVVVHCIASVCVVGRLHMGTAPLDCARGRVDHQGGGWCGRCMSGYRTECKHSEPRWHGSRCAACLGQLAGLDKLHVLTDSLSESDLACSLVFTSNRMSAKKKK